MNRPIIYTLSFLLCTASTALMAQAPPGPQTLERTLRTGEWSGNFTIAGFTGEDGFAPVVYDFAQRRDGTLLAAGMFQWSNGRRIGPLAERQRNGEWVSATEHWDREPPAIGFTSIATSDEDLVALSTNSGSFGSVPGEIWLNTGGAVRVIGRFNGAIRSMAWFDGDLWVAGFFHLAEGGTQHLAVWNGESWSAHPGER